MWNYRLVLSIVLISLFFGPQGTFGASAIQVKEKYCADFQSQEEAQEYFVSRGGSPDYNADFLDADGDGIACETLPRLSDASTGANSRMMLIGAVGAVGAAASALYFHKRTSGKATRFLAPQHSLEIQGLPYHSGQRTAPEVDSYPKAIPTSLTEQNAANTHPNTSRFIPKEQLNQMPYDEYLKTAFWQTVRSNSLKRADYKCQLCGRRDLPLHVHHNDYRRRGFERAEDLFVLCEIHHKDFHKNGQMPV